MGAGDAEPGSQGFPADGEERTEGSWSWPRPVDHPDTWSEFLKRHAHVMWQCDFACKRKWTTQQARNFAMHVQEHGLRCELVKRDNDAKYIDSFDSIFKSTGARIKRTTHQSPNLQAFVERVVQTLKHEILNAFCIVNEQKLDHILSRCADWLRGLV